MNRAPRAPVRPLAIPLVMAGVWAAACGTGCQVFMNLDVSGYDAAPADAGACVADGACASLGCASNADCEGGAVCCLVIAPSASTSACQQGPCGSINVQLCRSSAECGDAGSCSACTAAGMTLSVCDSTFTALVCQP